MKASLNRILMCTAFVAFALFAPIVGADLVNMLPDQVSAFMQPEAIGGPLMLGMIINQGNLSNLFTGFKSSFNTGFRSSKPMWDQVATLVPSSAASEDYAWLGQYPKLREWLGDRQIKNMQANKYNIKNKKWESTIGVPREDIERDQYGIFSPLFAEMGYAASVHPDELIFGLLANAFTTVCFDGQFMVDTDHPVGTGVVSNYGGGASNPWFLMDLSRPLKPLIFQREKDYALRSMTRDDDEQVFMRDEYRYGVDSRVNVGFGFWQQVYGSKQAIDSAAFDAAYAAMMLFKSDDGRPLGIRATHIVAGPASRGAINQVVKAERNAAGATNTNQNAVDIVIVPWL